MNRQDDHRDEARLPPEARPDHAGGSGPDAGADERDADEVGRDQNQRAHEPAPERREQHPERLLGPDRGTDEQPADDESKDAQHHPEQSVAGETGHHAGQHQQETCRQLERHGEHKPADYMMTSCPLPRLGAR